MKNNIKKISKLNAQPFQSELVAPKLDERIPGIFALGV
jgi:hypothetical protein